MRSSSNFNHLEAFFVVAQELSFSKAAERLQIAQSAISKQIKSLEEHFGKQLLIRSRHSVTLSGDGQDLYQKIWPLYKEMSSRIEEIRSGSGELEGKLTFGCLEAVGIQTFAPLLNLFKKEHPGIHFDVRFLKAFQIIEGVKTGEIDIGIVPDQIIQENVRSYEILEEEVVVVASKKLESSLLDQSFVAYRQNDPLLDYYLKQAYPNAKKSKLDIQFYVNNHGSMIESVKEHNLCAVLPMQSVRKEVESGELCVVGPQRLTGKLYLIHLDLDYMNRRVVVLRDFLRKELSR